MLHNRLSIVLSFISVLFTQSIADKMNNYLKLCHDLNEFSGVVLAAKNAEIIYHQAFGIVDISTKKKLSSNDCFKLASLSKQFTGMAIMILKEQGKLKFDDNIKQYLPSIPYKEITVRHLLTHTSGLPDYFKIFEKFWDPGNDIRKRKTAYNNDVINLLIKHKAPILFKPGEEWFYSNTGYVLLASIIEKASGISYPAFIKKHIFDPLNMNHSHVRSASKLLKFTKRVQGFKTEADGSYSENDWIFLDGVYGDGGIVSNTEDLFKWDRALYNNQLVSEETLLEGFTPVVLNDSSTINYGFGFGLRKSITGKKRIGHSGSWFGFNTYISSEIEDNITLIILSNNSSRSFKTIRASLANILHGKETKLPKASIAKQFYEIFQKEGIKSAIQKYKYHKTYEASKYNFSEKELNSLGYLLLKKGKTKEAISVLEFNNKQYPESPNTYDSLGEAYFKANNNDRAIMNFKLALKLEPQFEPSLSNLKKLGVNVEEYIKKKITIDTKTLKLYQGIYQMTPNLAFNIKYENKKLFLHVKGRGKSELKEMSSTSFSAPRFRAKIHFNLVNKEVYSITIIRNGKKQVAKRIN